MPNFAVINEGIVTNIIVCENQEIAMQIAGPICLEYKETEIPHIGLKWSEDTGFEQPPVPEPVETPAE